VARSDFWLVHRLRVRFSETDRQGIVHNAVYLNYFGIALTELFRELPWGRDEAAAKYDTQMHVVQATISYKSPAQIDQELDVGARIAKLGRTSMTMVFQIFAAGEDTLIAEGEQVWVNTGIASHKPTPWSDAFRAVVRARHGTSLIETAPTVV
jgi:acyl-CoA thioester hydrolase